MHNAKLPWRKMEPIYIPRSHALECPFTPLWSTICITFVSSSWFDRWWKILYLCFNVQLLTKLDVFSYTYWTWFSFCSKLIVTSFANFTTHVFFSYRFSNLYKVKLFLYYLSNTLQVFFQCLACLLILFKMFLSCWAL